MQKVGTYKLFLWIFQLHKGQWAFQGSLLENSHDLISGKVQADLTGLVSFIDDTRSHSTVQELIVAVQLALGKGWANVYLQEQIFLLSLPLQSTRNKTYHLVTNIWIRRGFFLELIISSYICAALSSQLLFHCSFSYSLQQAQAFYTFPFQQMMTEVPNMAATNEPGMPAEVPAPAQEPIQGNFTRVVQKMSYHTSQLI